MTEIIERGYGKTFYFHDPNGIRLQIELKIIQDADSLEGDPDPVLSNIRNARVDTLPGQVRFTAELARWRNVHVRYRNALDAHDRGGMADAGRPPSSSAPMSRLYPAMSAARMAASVRSMCSVAKAVLLEPHAGEKIIGCHAHSTPRG